VFGQFSEQDWTAAIAALRFINEHNENKFHFKNILKGIGKIGGVLFKGARAVTKAIPLPMFQGVSKILETAADAGVGDLLDSMAGKKRRAAGGMFGGGGGGGGGCSCQG
jgi:hypothetical protein